ncbi:putative c2h2 finger domain protein [Venturia nashicola]|uniref:Putative c2h2 finger domain protein n=1 Tax=Venturia nashicola TaxID=86259 RepID=A0A4Z1NXK7_9PEZI|nr:putative c2h2 finger domain protein [Venturia nashicola]TLD27870.1 putative c2h2 finger domain protein [Venturia nashicola]
MWNATVPNPFGDGQQDELKDEFFSFPSEFQPYDSGFAPASGHYQQSESSFDLRSSEASFDFGQQSGTHFDPYSAYTQTSASNSDLAMPVSRRPAGNILSHHSSNAEAQRRQSAQSAAASSILRPSSTYTDTSFPIHSGAMSPISATGGHFFSAAQETYPYEISDFLDFNAGPELSRAGSPAPGSDDGNSGSSSHGDAPPRSHPLYNVHPAEDGYYHCPFVATENCGHEPKQLKCEYDKHIDSHLKPFRCKSSKCNDLQFSSTACLLRHEREAHDMHGHAESLCEYPPCNRSQPGQGFRRSYNCKDHMTRCHGWVDTAPNPDKKRRPTTSSGSGKNGITKPNKNKMPSKKQQIAALKQQWAERKAAMEQLCKMLAPDGPLFSMQITQIQHETELIAQISAEISRLSSKGMAG